MRTAIALLLLTLTACPATTQQGSHEAAIRSHCAEVGQVTASQATRPPVAYTWQGAPRMGYSGGYAAGAAAGQAARVAEQDCLLRNGLR